MNNEEKILYRKDVDVNLFKKEWLVIRKTELEAMCAVIAAAREIKDRIDACVNDTDLQHSFEQFDELEIE